jgi:hypothetical protein
MDDRLLVVGSMNPGLAPQPNSEAAIKSSRNRAISLEATRLIEPTLVAGAYRVQLVNDQLVWQDLRVSTDTTSRTPASA